MNKVSKVSKVNKVMNQVKAVLSITKTVRKVVNCQLLIILVGVAVVASSCKKDKDEDPAITAATCPDANLRAFLIENFDINRNGILSATEAAAVEAIDCSNRKITSLEGIEVFTSLSGLHCNDNLLTTLDVSKNTALGVLYCNGNQLTTLDVSKNTALIDLLCYRNQLTELDVSKNTALIQLYCSDNKLTAPALDALFKTLPTTATDNATIDIMNNPGTSDCNKSIAKDKGWKVLDF